MRINKFISIFALLILAVSFAFASPPGNSGNHVSKQITAVKFPPGVKTLSAVTVNFSEVKFAVIADAPSPPRFPGVHIVRFMPPEIISHGNYRNRIVRANNLFRKPKDFFAPNFNPPESALNVRPKPEIVRMT